jgi:hypothetical protein
VFRRSSSAVATKRGGQRWQTRDPAIQHRTFTRDSSTATPAPIRGAYRYAPDPISKRKKKIQKSDFFGFLFFPLLSICLDGSKSAQTVKKMMFDGES